MKISCSTKDTLSLNSLVEFQGELKKRTSKDINKIITSIKKFGFATPFFVWQHEGTNFVLDGHGRLSALHQMEKNGEAIPPLPVVYVNCPDEDTAKQLLLRITSQYGEMTAESVLEFMGDLDLQVDEISLPCGEINFFIDNDVEAEFPDLPSGDRTTACTMTFTLTQNQVEVIKSALKKCGRVDDEENKNSNGNALTKICEVFLNGN